MSQVVFKQKNKIHLTIMVCLAALTTDVSAGAFDVGFSLGPRIDKLQWNIAGNLFGSNPDILSELTWTDVESLQLRLFGRNYALNGGFYYGFQTDYGFIVNGKNQDSDYFDDNRQSEFSRSNNSADGGSTMDLSASFGYSFGRKFKKNGGWIFIPMLGYSVHEQKLEMTEANQTVATEGITPPLGPFGGLNSKYSTKWSGPWVGFRFEYDKGRVFGFFFDVQYHDADYKAEGEWNLRTDLNQPLSFKQVSKGDGRIISMGVRFQMKSRWVVAVSADYQSWGASRGLDETYFIDGSTGRTQLNEVSWESKAIMITPTYSF